MTLYCFYSLCTQMCGEKSDVASLAWTQPMLWTSQQKKHHANSFLCVWLLALPCVWHRVLSWIATDTHIKSELQSSSFYRHAIKSHVKCPKRTRSFKKKVKCQTLILQNSAFFCYPTIEHFITPSSPLENPDLPCQKRKKYLNFNYLKPLF